jgi:4'-phosphopantetheinyl transferase
VVAVGRAVGVDVENAARGDAPLDVASSYFSACEARALAALPAGDQSWRFFEYWTLKESYIKARGLGLAIPLRQFSFEFPAPRSLALGIDAALGDDAGRWLFWQLTVANEYVLAVCVERSGDTLPRLVCHPAIPSAASAARLLRRASADVLALPAHGVESVGTS